MLLNRGKTGGKKSEIKVLNEINMYTNVLSLGKKEEYRDLEYLEKAKGKNLSYLSLEFYKVQPLNICVIRMNYAAKAEITLSLNLSIYSNIMQWSFYF